MAYAAKQLIYQRVLAYAAKQPDRPTDRPTDRQADRQDRRQDRPTDRQAGRQAAGRQAGKTDRTSDREQTRRQQRQKDHRKTCTLARYNQPVRIQVPQTGSDKGSDMQTTVHAHIINPSNSLAIIFSETSCPPKWWQCRRTHKR